MELSEKLRGKVKMPKKRRQEVKTLALSDLLSLSFRDAIKYVQKLHEHVAKQNKKIARLKFKITKLKFLSKLDQHIAKTAVEETKEVKQQVEADQATSNKKHDKETEEQETVANFVNEIKAQAEINAWNQAGFVYEPTSGLYYDTKTGYYYNPQYDLYYNGTDGQWYRLDARTGEFISHSGTNSATDEKEKSRKKDEIDEDEAIRRILEDGRKTTKIGDEKRKYSESETSQSSNSCSDYHRSSHRRRRSSRTRSRSRSRSHRSRRKSKKNYRRSRSKSSNREEGECDSSDSWKSRGNRHDDDSPMIKRKKRKKKKGNEYEEIAKKYPPSLRLIVIESDKMEIGTLFVVTYKLGGSLGREGSHHTVIIPDVNVSKNHLKFEYSKKRGNYQVIDHSRNGTLIDGQQISSLNQKDSDPHDLHHDNILQISNSRLLCHVHEGLSTCNECEPFNYSKPPKEPEKVTEDPQPSNLSHKEQLKLLQKRYGLQSEKYQENPTCSKNKNYEDRAETRRVKVGSSHDAEKTVQASVNTSISKENKGFKLLSKMGWSEGKSIGKSQEGIKEPVQLKSQQGTSGLGNEGVNLPSTYNTKKKNIWNKTQERYKNINKDENIFED